MYTDGEQPSRAPDRGVVALADHNDMNQMTTDVVALVDAWMTATRD
jgi:hypothetical protein